MGGGRSRDVRPHLGADPTPEPKPHACPCCCGTLTHKSDHFHLEALVLTALLYQLLTMKIHRDLCRKHGSKGWLSIEKTCDFFSIYLLNVSHQAKAPPFDPDLRHLRYEKRNRANHWEAIIHSLG